LRKINDLAQLNMCLHEKKIGPVSAFDLTGYGNLYFECGCGKKHLVNHGALAIMAAHPVSVLYRCLGGFYSMVRIKGWITQKAITEWYCEAELLEEGDDGGPYTYSTGGTWITFDPPHDYELMLADARNQ
jgi:hypothetical protein